MRELKREEYGMISGGIDTFNMPKLFVDAPPPPPNGVYIPSSGTGNVPRGADSGGGSATVHFNANGNITSATVNCPTGTHPSIASGGGNVTVGAKTLAKIIGGSVGLSGGGGTVTCIR